MHCMRVLRSGLVGLAAAATASAFPAFAQQQSRPIIMGDDIGWMQPSIYHRGYHDVVQSGLRHVIESQPNWQVVAEAADGKEAVQKALETKPDVGVIDYSLPLINGVDATRQIRSALPHGSSNLH